MAHRTLLRSDTAIIGMAHLRRADTNASGSGEISLACPDCMSLSFTAVVDISRGVLQMRCGACGSGAVTLAIAEQGPAA